MTIASPFWSVRHGSNVWAQSPATIAAWRLGALESVMPLSCEFSPVLACNADCIECPWRRSRAEHGVRLVRRGDTIEANDVGMASEETITVVLDRCAAVGIRGVLWTGGGEPTLLPSLSKMCEYAGQLGLVNALYTNGFLLGTDPFLAGRLLDPKAAMVFIRISVNAISSPVVRKHWGVRDHAEVLHQLEGLDRLLRERRTLAPAYAAAGQPLPSIQISTIVDRRNVDDLPAICRTVADIFGRHRDVRGPEDIMVIRPLTIHRISGFSVEDHDDSVIRSVLDTCGARGLGRQRVEACGLSLYLGFGLDLLDSGALSRYSDVVRRQYQVRDRCWGHGLFLTVGPDAKVYPCTEMNCNSEYVIGDLRTQAVTEIYQSSVRREFIQRADGCRWGPSMFQPFSRTTRLDGIAQAIRNGSLSDIEIDAIRRASLTQHPLLLN